MIHNDTPPASQGGYSDAVVHTPSDDILVAKILRENTARLSEGTDFDPYTGRGSIGEREMLHIPDFMLPRQWIPLSMASTSLVRVIRHYGSIAALARAMESGEWEAREWKEMCSPRDGHSSDHDEGSGTHHAICAVISEMLLRMRLMHDFPFWCAVCVRIKRKGGGDDIPFRLNGAQRRLATLFEECRLRDEPIRLILLKARQWGGSTCVQIYMGWLQLIHSRGLNSLILSHQGTGSDEIKDMYDRMIRHYDPALMYEQGSEEAMGIRRISDDDGAAGESMYSYAGRRMKVMTRVGQSGGIFKVIPRNCKIKIGSAERPDACRGADSSLVHLSEVGIWRKTDGKSPEDIVRAACSGVLYRPLTMIVMESTANGTGNYFHREYLAARQGESQFCALFVSWYEIEQYRLPFADEEERRSFAESLISHRHDTQHQQRRQSGSYMWRLWESGATLEALHWYSVERRKYSDHALMAAEYPSDDTEAFAHSGIRVFDPSAVEALRGGIMEPAYVGALTAQGQCGAEALRDIRFCEDSTGALSVWRMPDTSEVVTERYLCVVDVGGRSMRADWSVAVVIDRAPLMHGGVPEVVAQWRGHTDHDRLAVVVSQLAKWYGDALLVIESNTLDTRDAARLDDGDTLPFLTRVLRDVYPNLYARPQSDTDIVEGRPVKYGFHTNVSTKPMIIHNLVQCIRDSLYVERDAEAINELHVYEQRPGGSYGAIAGCHDDILMTRAIALFVSQHEMGLPSRRTPRRTTPRRSTW